MAIKVEGENYAIGQDKTWVLSIPSLVDITATTVSTGYQTNEPILGSDGNRKSIVFSNLLTTIQFTGYLKAGATPPAKGDAITVNSKPAAITDVSIAYSAGVTVVTGTVETATETDSSTTV